MNPSQSILMNVRGSWKGFLLKVKELFLNMPLTWRHISPCTVSEMRIVSDIWNWSLLLEIFLSMSSRKLVIYKSTKFDKRPLKWSSNEYVEKCLMNLNFPFFYLSYFISSLVLKQKTLTNLKTLKKSLQLKRKKTYSNIKT